MSDNTSNFWKYCINVTKQNGANGKPVPVGNSLMIVSLDPFTEDQIAGFAQSYADSLKCRLA